MALVLLLKLVNLVIYLVERTHLVQRQAHDTALLGNSLQNGLTNPPHSIADELKAARLVELLSSLNQSNVSFVNQVGQCQALMLVLLGHGNYETQVSGNEFVLRTFALWAALSDFLCQFYFLVNTNQRCTSNFYQILVQSLTRTVGDALLNFKLSHLNYP